MVLEPTKSLTNAAFSKRKIQFTANSQLVKIRREFTNQNLNQNLLIFQVVSSKSIKNLHNIYFRVKSQPHSMALSHNI